MTQTRQEIRFYGTQDEFGCFSNFAYSPIRLQGRVWTTVEHFFQAQKFPGTEHEEAIRQAKTPAKAKTLGRSRKFKLRRDWEAVKDGIMREAVLAKFTTHPEMRALLLSTEDAKIIENSPTDDYWGCGSSGHGKNKLGLILMKVREELRRAESQG